VNVPAKAAGEDVVEQVLGIVQIHLDLFENNLALLVDVIGIELGTQNEVGENIEGDGRCSSSTLALKQICSLEVKASSMPPTESISRAISSAERRSVPLKTMLLQEMGQAVFGGDFAARAVADPDADGDGAHVLHGLGNDDEAVGKNVALDVADVGDHESIVTHGGERGEWRVRHAGRRR